jgi:hypothetical protein
MQLDAFGCEDDSCKVTSRKIFYLEQQDITNYSAVARNDDNEALDNLDRNLPVHQDLDKSMTSACGKNEI